MKKGTVNTVEGNSEDAVRKRSYPVGDGRIYGYGIIDLMFAHNDHDKF